MKLYKKLLIIPLLSFICLPKVYAECSQAEIDEFKKIENQFTVTYEYNSSTKKYTIYLNRPNDKYTYSIPDEIDEIGEEPIIESKRLILKNVPGGEYEFNVVLPSPECDASVKTVSINTGKYNKYSESELCNGNEDFYLCQETYEGNEEIDEETFESRLDMYKEKKEQQEAKIDENKTEEKGNKLIENKIIDFIKENIIYISITMVLLLIIILWLILSIKKHKKRSVLE